MVAARCANPPRPPAPRLALRCRTRSMTGSYDLCTTNAVCNAASNACACATNYYGTGTSSCTRASCSSTTLSGITYPSVAAGLTSTGDCPYGFVGTATRTCVQSTSCTPTSGTTGCPTGTFPDNTLTYNCQQLLCQPPAGVEYNAAYNTSVAIGGVMFGYCSLALGYSGTVTRVCSQTGSGTSAVAVLAAPTTSCTVVACPALSGADTNWPAWPTGGASTAVTGTCNSGYAAAPEGPPTRTCYANGTWDAATVHACAVVQCPPIAADDSTGQAGFASVPWSAVPVAGTCPPSYGYGSNGAVTRVCTSSGTWLAESNPCAHIQCAALAASTATGAAAYNATDASVNGTVATGACPAGWTSSTSAPMRTCTLSGPGSGTWSDSDSPACSQLFCPQLAEDDNAAWPQAAAGSSAVIGACKLGYVQTPPLPQRACQLDGAWSASILNRCAIAFCPGISELDVQWPSTVAGGSAFGNCSLGFSVGPGGPPGRACLLNGTWASDITNACVQRVCPAVFVDGYANWTDTLAATSSTPTPVYGTCIDGFLGSPSRVCWSNGTWGGVMDACIPNVCAGQPDCQLNCTARIEFNAQWPDSISPATVTGTCVPGFAGTPVRVCAQYGAWQSPTVACTQVSCPATADAASAWPSALSGTAAVSGTCVVGYANSGPAGEGPTRACLASPDCNATACPWGDITNPCARITCPAQNATAWADWPAALSGTTSTGTCIPGYAGTPTRQCNLDGSWGAVTSACTQLFCPTSTQLPATDDPTAFWQPVSAGSTGVAGTCKALYGPAPRRYCPPATAGWMAPGARP